MAKDDCTHRVFNEQNESYTPFLWLYQPETGGWAGGRAGRWMVMACAADVAGSPLAVPALLLPTCWQLRAGRGRGCR